MVEVAETTRRRWRPLRKGKRKCLHGAKIMSSCVLLFFLKKKTMGKFLYAYSGEKEFKRHSEVGDKQIVILRHNGSFSVMTRQGFAVRDLHLSLCSPSSLRHPV